MSDENKTVPMNYQVKVIECEAASLESALNRPAAEGWQLISCWPDGKRVRAVFQREAHNAAATAPSRPTDQPSAVTPEPSRAVSALPPDDTLLDQVIAACEPPKDGSSKPPGIKLGTLRERWHVSERELRARIEKLGVREKTDPKSKDHKHNGYYIWLKGDYVNIREAKRKPPTRP
jgi:hypothetical protein